MLKVKPEEDFKVGDFVRFLSDLDDKTYGVIIKYNSKHSLDFPYCVRILNGYTIWMSEWDLEKLA